MIHPIGTRIRFTKTLEEGPCDHSPASLYARKGELGEVTGHGTREGYWVKRDDWPAPFGASADEFEVIEAEAEAAKSESSIITNEQSGATRT